MENSADIIIRPAAFHDLQSILDIYNDAILYTTAVYDYYPHTLEMRAAWFAAKQQNDIPVFVAEINSQVSGFASYGPFRAWAAYKYAIEHSVYVHPDHRRKGIAKSLLRALIESVHTKQVHTIIAGIDADNAISIQLHRQFGFKEIAHFKEVGYKFNKWLDLKFMQLIIQNNLQPNEHYDGDH